MVATTAHARGFVTAPHLHELASINLVTGGLYAEQATGATGAHEPGTLIYKPAGETHSNAFRDAGARCVLVELDPKVLERIARVSIPARTVVLQSGRTARIAEAIERELAIADDATPAALAGYAFELLSRVTREHPRADGTPRRRALATEEILRSRLRTGVSLAELADATATSPATIARDFRRTFGCSVGERLRQLRVERLRALLDARDGGALSALALEAGFADQSHGTRVFRDLTGMTPGSYRSRHAH